MQSPSCRRPNWIASKGTRPMRNASHVLVRRLNQFTTDGASNFLRRSRVENAVDLRIDSFCGPKLLYCRLNQPRQICQKMRMISCWVSLLRNPRLVRNSANILQSLGRPCWPRWYSSEELSDPCGRRGPDKGLGAWRVELTKIMGGVCPAEASRTLAVETYTRARGKKRVVVRSPP